MKRSNLAQTNFFSLLAPPVPLSSNIVLLDDPRRSECLAELQQAKHIGFDLEYYGSWQTKKDIDHTRAIIRLIQVGLPSGLVLIADLGTPEQREQQLERHSSFLAVLRPILASREVLKVGQALKGDLVALECNLGITVRAVRDVMLFSQVLWAGVGAAKPKKPKGRPETPEERQRRLKFVGLRHTLQAIAQRTGTQHEDHQDGDQYTGSPYWAGKITNNDLNIAASRTGVVLPIWRRLCQWVREAELIDSVLAECEALPAFAECEINGLPVDWATLNDAINKWSAARNKVLAVWHETFPKVDPLKKEKVAVALSNALGLTGDDRLYSLGDPGKNGKRKILPRVNDETLIPYDSTTPGNENAEPERAKIYRAVHAYLEHNSIFVQLSYLLGFKKHYYRGSVRSKYFQIAMGSKPGKEFETGKGMGRSSASDPNSQNSPNLQPAHKAAGLPHPRSVVRRPTGHSLILADLAASHARIATQASLDPVLIDIFNSGKDLHCVTANGLLNHKGHQFTYDDVHRLNTQFKKYNKALEKGENPAAIPEVCYEVAATRALSKGVFYGAINLNGDQTLQKTGATGAEPVFMTLEQAHEGNVVWKQTYNGLHGFQRSTIKKANAFKVRFDQPGVGPYSLGLPGEYAVVRGLSKRRLFLLKEQDKHGRFSCKGTDCVSFVWMGTEADIIKRAMGRILAEFDQHPEWGAKFRGMAHDDVCVTCLTVWENDVAQCVQREFDDAMKWVIKVIPVSDGDWKSTIVGSWAAK